MAMNPDNIQRQLHDDLSLEREHDKNREEQCDEGDRTNARG